MKIRKFDVYQVALPFRVRFRHARASRSHSASIFVRCELEDGSVGFGESLPREYVTGESWAGCFADLRGRVLPWLLERCDFHEYDRAEQFCESLYDTLPQHVGGLPRRIGATCCAAELALLDAYGRHFGRTAFAAPAEASPRYSGVISSSGLMAVLATSWLCHRAGAPAVKLKVGGAHDVRDARLARAILGSQVSLRVDANMSWRLEQALAVIPRLGRYGVHYVEQPLATGRYDELRLLQERTGIAVVADEDLCDLSDAQALIERRACRVFNLRVSKCGGFFNTLRLGQLARQYGLEVQMGCQVGETALLSAVGLAVGRRLAPVVFAEGCFGQRLLVEDLMLAEASEGAFPFEFGPGGLAPSYAPSAGIGIAIDEARLRRHATAHAGVRARWPGLRRHTP